MGRAGTSVAASVQMLCRPDAFSDEGTVEQWRVGHPPGDPFPMNIALTDHDIWMLYTVEGALVRLPRP